MGPSGLDPERYTAFARQHLADAIAVVGKVVPDPALALDVASEAIALAYGGDDAHDETAARRSDRIGQDAVSARAVLDALENVYRATLASEVVPKGERLRRAEPRATSLDARARDGIMRLCRTPLAPGSPAAHATDVLCRDTPNAAALRRIRGSGLVQIISSPSGEPKSSDSEAHG